MEFSLFNQISQPKISKEWILAGWGYKTVVLYQYCQISKCYHWHVSVNLFSEYGLKKYFEQKGVYNEALRQLSIPESLHITVRKHEECLSINICVSQDLWKDLVDVESEKAQKVFDLAMMFDKKLYNLLFDSTGKRKNLK